MYAKETVLIVNLIICVPNETYFLLVAIKLAVEN